MDVTEAIKKLNEYAKCGLAYNGRDITLADKWTDIVSSHIAKEPTTPAEWATEQGYETVSTVDGNNLNIATGAITKQHDR